ncbi:hypothetical protein [Streptomyces sp. NPDC058766]|uniref:hypothetical protein n=1 Tax=Streptomyces sp. NPDC058766 TaxID=3346630 RepID=UPI0036923FF2
MTAHAAEPTPAVPPMPERTARALREAIAEHAPQLLSDFDEHGKWAVADAYDISTVPAFMARWWGQYAIARDPRLDAHVTDLEQRASECTSTRPRHSSKRRPTSAERHERAALVAKHFHAAQQWDYWGWLRRRFGGQTE